MRITKIAIGGMLLLVMAGGLWAQDADTETPLFVRSMVQLMTEEGWTNADIAEFRQACTAYQWEGLDDVDPQMLMRALRYSYEYGEPENGPVPGSQAELAHELALQAREMMQLGLDSREISRVAVTATRASLQDRTNTDGDNEESGDRLRNRVQEATRTQVQTLERTRARENDSQGTATRAGEDTTPGTAPTTPGSTPDADPGPNPEPGPGDGLDGPRN